MTIQVLKSWVPARFQRKHTGGGPEVRQEVKDLMVDDTSMPTTRGDIPGKIQKIARRGERGVVTAPAETPVNLSPQEVDELFRDAREGFHVQEQDSQNPLDEESGQPPVEPEASEVETSDQNPYVSYLQETGVKAEESTTIPKSDAAPVEEPLEVEEEPLDRELLPYDAELALKSATEDADYRPGSRSRFSKDAVHKGSLEAYLMGYSGEYPDTVKKPEVRSSSKKTAGPKTSEVGSFQGRLHTLPVSKGGVRRGALGLKAKASSLGEVARLKVSTVRANKAERKGKEEAFWENLYAGQKDVPPSHQKAFRKSKKKAFETQFKIKREADELGIPKQARVETKGAWGSTPTQGPLLEKSTAHLQREILAHKLLVQHRGAATEKIKPFTQRKAVSLVAKTAGKTVLVAGKRLPRVKPPARRRSVGGVAPQTGRLALGGKIQGRMGFTGANIQERMGFTGGKIQGKMGFTGKKILP